MSDNRTLRLSQVELRSREWYDRQMANTAPASVRAREALLRLAEEYKVLAAARAAAGGHARKPRERPDPSDGESTDLAPACADGESSE